MRHHRPTTDQALQAVIAAPYLHALAGFDPAERTGRHATHPPWVVYAYGALARHFRSANHLDANFTTDLWEQFRAQALTAGLPDPGPDRFRYHHYIYWRDRIMGDADSRDELTDRFTAIAASHATSVGLLGPRGGSLTNPDPTRTIYGDGTVVRPATRKNQGNPDPSVGLHHRFDGPVWGTNFVAFHVRHLDQPNSRITLSLTMVPKPGLEAVTAVEAIQRLRPHIPHAQAVAYDGALSGKHIDELMRTTGLVVINKLAPRSQQEGTKIPHQHPLSAVVHDTDWGDCTHTLHTRDGHVVDVALSDDGSPVIVSTARRRQVKRAHRKDGTYTFHLQLEVPCHKGEPLVLWLSPHPTPTRPSNPQRVRLLPPGDPLFPALYGLRNDSESFNANLKRTLLSDRAPSHGWQRQLFDYYAYAILHNSLNWAAIQQGN